MKAEEIKNAVKNRYGQIASGERSTCATVTPCCGTSPNIKEAEKEQSQKLGYSGDELRSVPDTANLGLGCGNPIAFAELKAGDTVLDLGSGAGLDCFLAARQVGPVGKVIGVDMTEKMIEKARLNAAKGNYDTVEFRLGEIEDLPADDQSVDLVISNCVINLSPDKRQVFREAFRVLKPGGRLMVSDLVLLRELPESLKSSVAALTGCIAGALLKEDYLDAIRAAGFQEVTIIQEFVYPISEADEMVRKIAHELEISGDSLKQVTDRSVSSIQVSGLRPK